MVTRWELLGRAALCALVPILFACGPTEGEKPRQLDLPVTEPVQLPRLSAPTTAAPDRAALLEAIEDFAAGLLVGTGYDRLSTACRQQVSPELWAIEVDALHRQALAEGVDVESAEPVPPMISGFTGTRARTSLVFEAYSEAAGRLSVELPDLEWAYEDGNWSVMTCELPQVSRPRESTSRTTR